LTGAAKTAKVGSLIGFLPISEEADMLGLYQQLGMELKPKAPAK